MVLRTDWDSVECIVSKVDRLMTQREEGSNRKKSRLSGGIPGTAYDDDKDGDVEEAAETAKGVASHLRCKERNSKH